MPGRDHLLSPLLLDMTSHSLCVTKTWRSPVSQYLFSFSLFFFCHLGIEDNYGKASSGISPECFVSQ